MQSTSDSNHLIGKCDVWCIAKLDFNCPFHEHRLSFDVTGGCLREGYWPKLPSCAQGSLWKIISVRRQVFCRNRIFSRRYRANHANYMNCRNDYHETWQKSRSLRAFIKSLRTRVKSAIYVHNMCLASSLLLRNSYTNCFTSFKRYSLLFFTGTVTWHYQFRSEDLCVLVFECWLAWNERIVFLWDVYSHQYFKRLITFYNQRILLCYAQTDSH